MTTVYLSRLPVLGTHHYARRSLEDASPAAAAAAAGPDAAVMRDEVAVAAGGAVVAAVVTSGEVVVAVVGGGVAVAGCERLLLLSLVLHPSRRCQREMETRKPNLPTHVGVRAGLMNPYDNNRWKTM